MSFEFEEEKPRIYFRGDRVLHGGNEGETVPPELVQIQQEWAEKANAYGDVGSCVIGEGFEFTYNGKDYKMPPASRWQGSCSWEAFVDETTAALVEIGATDIRFNYGVLD